jgi:hypothetical protein
MCNLYSIPTNQAAIIALFRVVDRSVRMSHDASFKAQAGAATALLKQLI